MPLNGSILRHPYFQVVDALVYDRHYRPLRKGVGQLNHLLSLYHGQRFRKLNRELHLADRVQNQAVICLLELALLDHADKTID